MSSSNKKWMIHSKRADFTSIAQHLGISPVAVRVMRNRGMESEEEMGAFLEGNMRSLHSPLRLPDMHTLISHLYTAITNKQHIRIVGDYDVDGVCSTYILVTGLRRIGCHVDYEIPDRVKDGYGINVQIIDRAKEDGVSVILTCDNGISAISELEHARELGIQVLVTDHHDVRKDDDGNDILPPADAVVDAKRQDSKYPFPEICGATVALKVIEQAYRLFGVKKDEILPLMEFAGLATVCDVVKLTDENRVLVKEALVRIPQTQNLGLRALLSATGLSDKPVLSSYDFGFLLGPCINAGGRLETAQIALKLFLSENKEDAEKFAQELYDLNEKRKELTNVGKEQAFDIVEKQYLNDKVLVVYLPTIHESLAGIVAGKLRERYYRPTLVITNAEMKDGEEPMVKGSGRSVEGYPMSEKLAEAGSLLAKFGGHPMAAGFSLKKENIDALRIFLNDHADLTEDQLTEQIWIDVPMPIDYVSESLISDLSRLEPFGQGNEKPKFAARNLKICSGRVLGKKRNVVKLDLMAEGGKRIEGLLFTDGDQFMKELGGRTSLDIIYYPSVNEYMGNRTLQVRIEEYILKS